MGNFLDPAMKRTQLLSIVFSLIMFTGVTAGNVVVHADSDDLEDKLEDFCEMTSDEQSTFLSENDDIAQYEQRLGEICNITDEDEREDAIEEFIEENFEEKDDSSRQKDYEYDHEDTIEDKLDKFCEMSEDKREDFVSLHDKTEEHVAKMNEYCELSEEEREALLEEFEEEYEMMHTENFQSVLDSYCEMSEDKRVAFLAEHDKTAEHEAKMNQYCDLDDQGKEEFIEEHLDEYIFHVKHEKMSDYNKDHKMLVSEMQQKHKDVSDNKKYEKYCEMSGAERAEALDDLEKLESISEWCEMTPEEREEFEMTHHDVAMDFKEQHHEEHDDQKKKMMDEKRKMSPHLKDLIMNKHEISDEKLEQIKEKYHEKYGEISDEKKSEISKKYKEYMSSKLDKMSDEHKTAIHERIAEMKAFKEEIRTMSSELTKEEKQDLREEFIEKAKDLHLAWISPRVQVVAGLEAGEIQCREGYTLVLKESNGMPMCLTADSALKMIDKGIAVLPAA